MGQSHTCTQMPQSSTLSVAVSSGRMRGGLSLEAGAGRPQQPPTSLLQSGHKPALELGARQHQWWAGISLGWGRQGTLSQRNKEYAEG